MATAAKKTTTTKKPAAASKKPTATQRIQALESKLLSNEDKMIAFEKNFMILADEIDQLKTVISGLNRRLNAIIQAGDGEGGINSESVDGLLLENSMKELESRVSFLVEQGVLEPNMEGTTNNMTFLVGKEIDDEGKVTQPRIQFSINSLDPSLQEKLTGYKVGDKIKLRDEDPMLEILEIYSILDKNVEKQYEETESGLEEEVSE